MTTLTDRANTALLVIDVQNAVLDGAHERDAVVARVAALVEHARAEHVPIVWVQHSSEHMPPGTEGWQYVTELVPGRDEPVVHKRYPDSFEDTDLEGVLAEGRIGRLVVAGAQTDECIRATLHGAIGRGYDATLVSDAHTTKDHTEYGALAPGQVIDHTNLYWQYHRAPGRAAGTVTTDSVDFGGSAPPVP